jgi:hypothetical protein
MHILFFYILKKEYTGKSQLKMCYILNSITKIKLGKQEDTILIK